MADLHADLAALADEVYRDMEADALGGYDKGTMGVFRRMLLDKLAAHTPPSEPATEGEVWGNGCECWVTPEHMWTTHYGAVEPGSQVEFNPDCPEHGAQSAAVPDDLPVATGWAGSGPEGVERVEERCLRVVRELSDLLDQIAERIDEVGRVDRTDFLDIFTENHLRELLPSIAENWEPVEEGVSRNTAAHAPLSEPKVVGGDE